MKRKDIEKFMKNSINLFRSGKYSNALNKLKKIEKEISILTNVEQIAFYQLFGQCYIGEKDWVKAEEYYFKAAEISTDAKIYGIATESCTYVAILNFGLNNIVKGIQFGEKSLEIFPKSKDSLFDDQLRSASPNIWEEIKNNLIFLYKFLNRNFEEAHDLLSLILINVQNSNYGKNSLKLYEIARENFSRSTYQFKEEIKITEALYDEERIIHEIKRHGRFSLKDPHTRIKADKGKWIDAVMQITSEKLKIKNKNPKDDKIDLIVKLEDILSITKKNSLIWGNPLTYIHVNTKFNDFYVTIFGKALQLVKWEIYFNEFFTKLVKGIKQRKFIVTHSEEKLNEDLRTEEIDTDVTHITTTDTILCPQCGIQLPAESLFCPNCGASIR